MAQPSILNRCLHNYRLVSHVRIPPRKLTDIMKRKHCEAVPQQIHSETVSLLSVCCSHRHRPVSSRRFSGFWGGNREIKVSPATSDCDKCQTVLVNGIKDCSASTRINTKSTISSTTSDTLKWMQSCAQLTKQSSHTTASYDHHVQRFQTTGVLYHPSIQSFHTTANPFTSVRRRFHTTGERGCQADAPSSSSSSTTLSSLETEKDMTSMAGRSFQAEAPSSSSSSQTTTSSSLETEKDVTRMAGRSFKAEAPSSSSSSPTTTSSSLETEEDVARLAGEVVREGRKVEVMVGSVPVWQVEDLILGLHHCGCPPSHISSLLSSHPLLLLHHRSVLPTVHLLLNLGLDLTQVVTLLHRFPGVVKVAPTRIDETVEALRTGRFRERSIAKILAGNPRVLLVAAAKLGHRLGMLRQLFKTADVIALVVDSPQVLTEEWSELQAKFDYVFHEMKITQRQMVYASLFTHPLSHLQHRHSFLVRAGFFSMAKRREGERSPNARLDQIVSSSDQAFCRRFGGFEVAEYRAFCQLYDKERAAAKDSDSESDSDDV